MNRMSDDRVPLHPRAGNLASIVIVTYNHRKYIESCLESIAMQQSPYEIILVDNGSTDGTAEFVRERYPDVRLIVSSRNGGYGAGNNLGARAAKGDYLVILNPDTVVNEGWLNHLVQPLSEGKKVISTPKILTYDGSRINTCGNINHFSGLTFTRGFGKSPSEYTVSSDVSGVSGACFGLMRKDFFELSGFDENFFMYNEDSDLSWRANALGYKILFVPDSVIFHDYELKVNPDKLYHLEFGRYLILRKYYSRRDLFLILPSLIICEMLTTGYASKFGPEGIRKKLSAFLNGCRCDVPKAGGNRDRLTGNLCPVIPEDQLTTNLFEQLVKRLSNIVFALNYEVFR